MLLNIFYPAVGFVPEGIPTEVDLFCIDETSKRIDKKLQKVFIKVTTSPSYSIAEVDGLGIGDAWNVNVFYATKITNLCDDSVIYVKNYIADIQAQVHCCVANVEESFWIDYDDAPVNDEDGEQINYI